MQWETESESSDGVPKVNPIFRPFGTSTVFMGCGDDLNTSVVGSGERMLWSLNAEDTQDVVDIVFNEDVYIKDGLVCPVDAPVGAYLTAFLVHPLTGDVVGGYSHYSPVIGSIPCPLDTEGRGFISKGLILRMVVGNASGTGKEDPPKAFKVMGRLELFRKNTF